MGERGPSPGNVHWAKRLQYLGRNGSTKEGSSRQVTVSFVVRSKDTVAKMIIHASSRENELEMEL